MKAPFQPLVQTLQFVSSGKQIENSLIFVPSPTQSMPIFYLRIHTFDCLSSKGNGELEGQGIISPELGQRQEATCNKTKQEAGITFFFLKEHESLSYSHME